MENDFSFPKDIYAKYLATINSVKFTPREIDIIAFISSGRSGKKTASFFSISPKTVENHTSNIMEKIGCNSREGIIDFIEKAGKISLLKGYYLKSLTHAEFEKSLKGIFLSKQNGACSIVYWEGQDLENSLVYHLVDHLKIAGVSISLKTMKNSQSYSELILKPYNDDYVIYVFPSIKLEGLSLDPRERKTPPENVLFLFFGSETIRELPNGFTNLNCIDLTKQKNYFDLVFEILKRFLPASPTLETAFEEFKRKEESLNNFSVPLPPPPYEQAAKAKYHIHSKIRDFLKNRWRLILLSLLISGTGMGSVGFLVSKGYFERKKKGQHQNLSLSVRSDLALPPESTLLMREKTLTQIKNELKGQEGIQTVFLVGIGGSGKTTLARLYAQQQTCLVVWEINAESRESLINSFENLAFFLSQTEKEKRLLKGLKEIKKLEEREGSIISFVGKKLKVSSDWLLIYDNVEKFNVVWKYFPQHLEMGEKGKIIVSTRDSNMHTNSPLSHSIQVDELTPAEKLDLFIKIMSLERKTSFSPGQKKNASEFLKFIPPFPLDVSTAAYYLKATNTSYKNYLEHLQEPNEAFTGIQESVLGESSDYAKSRYQIITLPLKRLIETDKDFGKLLLFVSLLDSTNIPRDLLDEFKNDIIVDKFIFCLKKYSLISSQTSPLLPSLQTFSMHRSTQAISFIYLTKTFDIASKQQLVVEVANTLMNYIGRVIEAEDFEKMKILIPHCETLISHHRSLKALPKVALSTALGCMYFYLGKYPEAKKILSISLDSLNSHEKGNHLWIARGLTYLGAVNISMGDHEAAKNALRKSIEHYKNYFSKSYAGQAQALRYLAMAYRDSGDYETAKGFFEDSLKIYQARLSHNYVGVARALGYVGDIYRELGNFEMSKEILEKSFDLHKEYFPDNELGIVWNFAHLGEVYGILGEYSKAKEILSRSLQICKEYLPENHAYFPWIYGCLGTAYCKLGNFEEAKDCLINSASLFKKNFAGNRLYYAWAIRHLGTVYGGLKNYEKAVSLLEESLKISEEGFGKDHVKTGLTLQNLAHVYLLQDQIEPAQNLIDRALKILQQSKHPELHVSLESLADIYLKKSLDAENKGDKQQSQKFKEQAITTLHKALEVTQTHFRANSPFITRIQLKINNFKECNILDKQYKNYR